MTVWLMIVWSISGISVAPQTFANEADCKAVVAQIPKSAGSGKCVSAVVK